MRIRAVLLFVGVGWLIIGGFYRALGNHPTSDPRSMRAGQIYRRMATYILGGTAADAVGSLGLLLGWGGVMVAG